MFNSAHFGKIYPVSTFISNHDNWFEQNVICNKQLAITNSQATQYSSLIILNSNK